MRIESQSAVSEMCSECGFLDFCREDGECIREALKALGFNTGLPSGLSGEDARDLIAAAKQPSAIIEPASATVLQMAGPLPVGAVKPGAESDWRAERFEITAGEPRPKVQFTRAQIRAAIAEIEGAQKQIVPAFEASDYLQDYIGGRAEKIDLAIVTAANVLEALPEAVAHAFGLTIRGACAFCATTIFQDEPKITDHAGKDICEACLEGGR